MKPTPQQIRAALQASGLTRKEMARELEYSVRALEDWIYGARNCRPAVYRKMLALSGTKRQKGNNDATE
jgi:DNA-binding transcriptional regulator YiaG